MKKQSLKGLIFLLIAAIIWGGAFVAQCIGADAITPLYFNGVRFFIGAVSLIPLILIFEKGADDRKKKKNTLLGGMLAGTFLCIASYLQQVGIEYTKSAGKAGFITGLYMILVPILGIFLGRKTGIRTWVAALLGVAGLFLICMTGTEFSLEKGDIFLIADSFMYAAHIITIDRFGDKIYSLRFSAVQFLTTAVISMAGALFTENITFAPLAAAVIPILYCGILSVGIGYTFQVLGQKTAEPTSASIILASESVFSAIFGAIILNERMTAPAYIGCVLIFAGIVISQLPRKKCNT